MSADHVSSRFACRRLTACLLFFTVFVLSASPYVETAVADAEKLILKKKYREAAKIAIMRLCVIKPPLFNRFLILLKNLSRFLAYEGKFVG